MIQYAYLMLSSSILTSAQSNPLIKVAEQAALRLVNAEFATIAVAHNIRKMISNGYVMLLHVTIYAKRMTNAY